jgi:hypothetical protein
VTALSALVQMYYSAQMGFEVAVPGSALTPMVGPSSSTVGTSTPLPLNSPHNSPPTPWGLGSGVMPTGSSDPRVATPADVALVDVGVVVPSPASSVHAPSSTPPPRPRTRLQNNIVKPKRMFLGMVCYANFYSTGEPKSVQEALDDLRWKHAMDLEYSALRHNAT